MKCDYCGGPVTKKAADRGRCQGCGAPVYIEDFDKPRNDVQLMSDRRLRAYGHGAHQEAAFHGWYGQLPGRGLGK